MITAPTFDADQVEAAASLASQAVVALENARLHRIVERQALFDSLTGLANRRRLEETMRAELARAARFHDQVCVVIADLDDFKRVNDTLRPRRRRRGAEGVRARAAARPCARATSPDAGAARSSRSC